MDNSVRYNIRLKRIYDPAAPDDGVRILVDRLWPRGHSKQRAAVDDWMKEIAPSPELRKWFDHRPERFGTFSESYIRELEEDPVRLSLAGRINEITLHQDVTLLYAANNPAYNHAAVLQRWLIRRC